MLFHHPPKLVQTEGMAHALSARPYGLHLWCPGRAAALPHPHELALTGISGRRVYCFATSAKLIGRDGRTRTFDVREDGAFTARCNGCYATSRNGGSGGIRTRIGTAYETVALLLCYRAVNWLPGQVPPLRLRINSATFCLSF
jgi:hypothetical protein